MSDRRIFNHAAAAGFIAALAVLTRYANLYLIAVGILYLLMLRQYRATLVFIVCAVPAPALWFLRNELLTGTLMGPRIPATLSSIQAFESIVWWFVDFGFGIGAGYVFGAVMYRLFRRRNVGVHIQRVDQ